MAQGKNEEARAFLVRFHGRGDPNSAVVALEWAEFSEDIAVSILPVSLARSPLDSILSGLAG